VGATPYAAESHDFMDYGKWEASPKAAFITHQGSCCGLMDGHPTCDPKEAIGGSWCYEPYYLANRTEVHHVAFTWP